MVLVIAAGCSEANFGVEGGYLGGDSAALYSAFYGPGSGIKVQGGATFGTHIVGGGRFIQYRFEPGAAFFNDMIVTDSSSVEYDLGDENIAWLGLIGIQFTFPINGHGDLFVYGTPLGDGRLVHSGFGADMGQLSYDNIWRVGIGYISAPREAAGICWSIEVKLMVWDFYNSGGARSDNLHSLGLVFTVGPRYKN